MAKLVIVDAVYTFDSDKEEAAAQILSEGNIQYIKTLISNERMARFNEKVDPNDYASFVQKEAEHKGAILALQMLLDRHYEIINRSNIDNIPTTQS